MSDLQRASRHSPGEYCDCRPYLRPFHCAVPPSRSLASALARIDALDDALRMIVATHAVATPSGEITMPAIIDEVYASTMRVAIERYAYPVLAGTTPLPDAEAAS